MTATNIQTKKRVLQGTVVSDKMAKTRVVLVSRVVEHSKYKKRYTLSRKFKAHDEANEYKTGDLVRIQETRPMSRDKRWVIISKI